MTLKCCRKDSGKLYVAKLMCLENEPESRHLREIEALSKMQHERIAHQLMCYKMNDKYLMVCEKLQGINVVQYLGSLHEYTEDMVATIVRQVSHTVV